MTTPLTIKEAILSQLAVIGPMTSMELAQEIGTTVKAISVCMMDLRKDRKVYVSKWVPASRQFVREYSLRTLNCHKDKPKPVHTPQSCDYSKRIEEYIGKYRELGGGASSNPFIGLMI